ncbi:MAG: TonB-dependent receptor, partial [Deltaproteobacteria bacterium]|nr:TonB-dependent receptor [Deltaproteobacteria bacterium]
YFVLDGLLGYDITKSVGVQFQVKNITGSKGKYPKGGRLMLDSENDNRGMQDVPIPPRTFFGTLTMQI